MSKPERYLDEKASPIVKNIECISHIYVQEQEKLSWPRRVVEDISDFVGRPIFLCCILLFVSLWIAVNALIPEIRFDPPPFAWLHGILTLTALLTATAVLIKQNREEQLDEQRAQLDLQVNLLAEKKTSKIINLLEELRRDLPNVKNRPDDEAEALKEATDPNEVLETIEEIFEPNEHANNENIKR